MVIEDKIYGSFEIEGVIEELVHSNAFERLRRVHQGGAIFLVDPSINHTRYEHSLGVFFLVKKMGGSLEEQIAALLHDISHTAFSHVVDYVFENKKEDLHEGNFWKTIHHSEIPGTLAKYDYPLSILDNLKYTILERPLPALCADRVDYTLRDLYYAKEITKEEINIFIDNLVLKNGEMALKSEAIATWIIEKYRLLNAQYFGKKEHVFANLSFAGILKEALSKGVITEDDLWLDDFSLLKILQIHKELENKIASIKLLVGLDSMRWSTENFKKRVIRPAVI